MQPDFESYDEDGGVFVMRCWVREDGELTGRVRWSTVDGDNGTKTLGGSADLVREARAFLQRVSRCRDGKVDERRK